MKRIMFAALAAVVFLAPITESIAADKKSNNNRNRSAQSSNRSSSSRRSSSQSSSRRSSPPPQNRSSRSSNSAPKRTSPPKIQTPQRNTSPRTITPKLQIPRLQQPRTQQPKTQQPKIQQPKTQQPRPQQARIQTPKIQPPKTQPPRSNRSEQSKIAVKPEVIQIQRRKDDTKPNNRQTPSPEIRKPEIKSGPNSGNNGPKTGISQPKPRGNAGPNIKIEPNRNDDGPKIADPNSRRSGTEKGPEIKRIPNLPTGNRGSAGSSGKNGSKPDGPGDRRPGNRVNPEVKQNPNAKAGPKREGDGPKTGRQGPSLSNANRGEKEGSKNSRPGDRKKGPLIQLNRGFVNPDRRALPGVASKHSDVKRPQSRNVRDRRNSLSNSIRNVRRVRDNHDHNHSHIHVHTAQLGYWPTWYGLHFSHHRSWIHGHCYRTVWSPHRRVSWWWDRYPVLTSLGITHWSLNRTGYAFGYNRFYNPYCYLGPRTVYYYDYTRPIIYAPGYSDPGPPGGVSDLGLQAFEIARRQFKNGEYVDALRSADEALKHLPEDIEIHQFRSVVLFALGQYEDSAAGLYAVLSVNPAWDWQTLRELYLSVEEFTSHLRRLESTRDAAPGEPAPRFVLAYVYQVMGYDDDAADQLQRLLAITPDDRLAADLLQQLDPEADLPPQPTVEPPPDVSETVTTELLHGTRRAAREDGGQYEMTLNEDGTFAWKYSKDEMTSQVTGVFALKEDGVLALEMEDGAVMLAQIVPAENGAFDFYMLGDSEGSPPLRFAP